MQSAVHKQLAESINLHLQRWPIRGSRPRSHLQGFVGAARAAKWATARITTAAAGNPNHRISSDDPSAASRFRDLPLLSASHIPVP
ncbi:hypothetical protein ACLOJK_006952, partial [Asimina triloba]